MFIHTRISAPNRYVKFGVQIRMCFHKKVEKAVAIIESDIL